MENAELQRLVADYIRYDAEYDERYTSGMTPDNASQCTRCNMVEYDENLTKGLCESCFDEMCVAWGEK